MENENEKIILPEALQKDIMKFFMKTSIPRKARQEREKLKAEKEGQERK